jgi:Predicted GTPase, probable translation factor
MGFKCGIIGLPNVGKSTLFNALTETNRAEAANYPFATIKPNIGRVPVFDERLNVISKISDSRKTIPTFMDFIDIAGLVKGASNGEGLGNKFLGQIREMDALAHVVRCFDDKNISHQSSTIDPIRDIETIETELKLTDIEVLMNKLESLKKKVKMEIKKQ